MIPRLHGHSVEKITCNFRVVFMKFSAITAFPCNQSQLNTKIFVYNKSTEVEHFARS